MPTYTPLPTNTPTPTATDTPVPTNTPTPEPPVRPYQTRTQPILLRRAARGDAALRGHRPEPERGVLLAVRPPGQHDAGLAGGRCGERAVGLGAALYALGGSETNGPGGGGRDDGLPIHRAAGGRRHRVILVSVKIV